uniref:Uncharacterized protein n=1 Tax=Candidozyma auris TaxID=498019 RepID=A0A0L0P699_CANAR
MGESLENGNVVPIYMAAKKPWGVKFASTMEATVPPTF